MKGKIVFHVPHDGGRFPEELMSSVCIPHAQFQRYHEEMRDYGVRLFIPQNIPHKEVIFEISRLLCDVERFIGENEVMERYGMGFCYERAYDGTQIKNVTDALKKRTFEYYKRHHDTLDKTVLGYDGKAVFFDLHNFSEKIIVKETLGGKDAPLPDICIGYDGYLPPKERKKAIKEFQDAGFSVAENYPYGGSLVPNAVIKGHTDAKTVSCMVEVNKTAYLYENGSVNERSAEKIRSVLSRLAAEFSR